MGHSYTHLTKDERQTIYKLLDRKIPLTQIARMLGRHHSTLYREIRRNYFHDRECPQWSGWFPWNAAEPDLQAPCRRIRPRPRRASSRPTGASWRHFRSQPI